MTTVFVSSIIGFSSSISFSLFSISISLFKLSMVAREDLEEAAK
jgi:hypothetical protein